MKQRYPPIPSEQLAWTLEKKQLSGNQTIESLFSESGQG